MTVSGFGGARSGGEAGALATLRHRFRSKDLFFHDGAAMRRVHVSAKTQVVGASAGIAAIGLSLFAAVQIGAGTPAVASAITSAVGNDAKVIAMSAKVAAMQAEMAGIRKAASDHAARLDQRQAFLDAVLTGKGAPAAMPASAVQPAAFDSVTAPLASAEGHQNRVAGHAIAATEARYRQTAQVLGRLGLDAGRFHQVTGAMGGPYEPLPVAGSVSANSLTPTRADPAFRMLFQSWKRLEQLQQGLVAIPSQRPVNSMTFTSGFGVRSDPFRGSAAMHAGVDMPGPMGTPIYATADGIVGRAGWSGGYGNLVELEHGKGIQTRYGHLSQILVSPGMRVARGQLIAKMGSTGRSTGSHLHYEVRLDGNAVNPMPFLQSGNYLIAMQSHAPGVKVAMGGPTE